MSLHRSVHFHFNDVEIDWSGFAGLIGRAISNFGEEDAIEEIDSKKNLKNGKAVNGAGNKKKKPYTKRSPATAATKKQRKIEVDKKLQIEDVASVLKSFEESDEKMQKEHEENDDDYD